MLTILGPTACGKTTFAVNLAHVINGEIISADSRQVFRNMDIGTGKDLQEYIIDGNAISHHLIDIVDAGSEYNVFQFQQDFLKAYQEIEDRQKTVILCGGTGLYLESVLLGYSLHKAPINPDLRAELMILEMEELQEKLLSLNKNQHNTTDLCDRERLIRAIEIETHIHSNPQPITKFPSIPSIVLGLQLDRSTIREKITFRLRQRLEQEKMIDEVQSLLDSGIHADQLRLYGLEYRYITNYLMKEITLEELFTLLNTAIHQFAKRQMTWLRRMEKKGIHIHWIDGNLPMERKIDIAKNIIKENPPQIFSPK